MVPLLFYSNILPINILVVVLFIYGIFNFTYMCELYILTFIHHLHITYNVEYLGAQSKSI